MGTLPKETLIIGDVKARVDETISKHRRRLNVILLMLGILVMMAEDHRWLVRLGNDEALVVIGWMLVITGFVVRLWSALYLGGRKNRQLVTTGPYAVVRNPLYAGNLISAAGLGVLSESLLAGLFVLGGAALIYRETISYEERKLLKKFGEDYRRYRRQVPMLIPRRDNIHKLIHAEDIHQVSYRNIRRELIKGLWLLAGAAGLQMGAEMIEHLQSVHQFAPYFRF